MSGEGDGIGNYWERERTYFCGAFNVLGVAADEGGLLLVGRRHGCDLVVDLLLSGG